MNLWGGAIALDDPGSSMVIDGFPETRETAQTLIKRVGLKTKDTSDESR